MKIRMTFDFTDTERRAIARDAREPIKATREVIERWVKATVTTSLECAIEDYTHAENKVNEAITNLTKTDRKILFDNLLAEMEPETEEEKIKEPEEQESAVAEGS